MFRRISGEDGYTGLFIDWIEEWSQFTQACNWYDFHPVWVELEWDRMLGGLEATLILLGLGVRVRWNYAETEQARNIREEADKIRATWDGEAGDEGGGP